MFDELELDLAGRSQLAREVDAYVQRYFAELPEAPASWPPLGDEAIAALGRPPSESSGDLASVFELLDMALASGINNTSGRFLSYIPSGGLYTAAVGRMLAAVANRYTGGSHGAPGLIALEHGVVRWMVDLFDLPAEGSGVLFSGGSTANLTATVAARSRLGSDFQDGVVYTSERAHHSIGKAAHIAGIGQDRIRHIRADGHLRLDMEALASTIAADKAEGLRPMMIVATAGTTDTGTIDPLPECAAMASAEGAWFHVDAAYGGFFALTSRGKDRLAGIELADSITVDAHKSLFMPFGVGGLLVRDEATLTGGMDGRGAYMQDVPDHATAIPNYFAMGPELTRPARGLEVWLALHLHGVDAFRRELDRMLDLTEWAAGELAEIEGIEIVAAPELSIVGFKAGAGNDVSRRIADRLNAGAEVHISSTTIGDDFVIRFAFLSQRTTKEIAERGVGIVRESLAAIRQDA